MPATTPNQDILIMIAKAMKDVSFNEAIRSLVAQGRLHAAYLQYSFASFKVALDNLLMQPWASNVFSKDTLQALEAAAASGGAAWGATGLLALLKGALFVGGVLVAAGLSAFIVYEGYLYVKAEMVANEAEERSDRQQRRVEERRRERPCPPARTHKTMCPWGPAKGYHIGECAVGHCWDGGPRGVGACRQTKVPRNAKRGYTGEVICHPGFASETDRCTRLVTCVPR